MDKSMQHNLLSLLIAGLAFVLSKKYVAPLALGVDTPALPPASGKK